jgi:Ca-activated chloride channel family protein
MTHLQFAQPHWLWMGALGCAIVVGLFVRAGRLRRRANVTLAGGRFVTTVSRTRRVTKQTLLVLGIAAAFATLARPQWGFRWEQERREGIDLMFAVDTSKSMRATDLRPDRLTRAKLAVSDLLRAFPGERVGLIAFAGEALVQAPMTIDHAVFGESLDALDTSIIPRGGTDIASAIRAAVRAMSTEPDRRKVLVILSDGEDLEGETTAAAKEAARAGLVIYTVGVGTPAGELVPVEHNGQRDVTRDADGQPVHSRLDEETLRRLAQTTGGAYAALGPSGRGLDQLYRQYLSRLPTRTVEERMHKVYTERFQIPLGLAIACLLLELALGDRTRRRALRLTPAGQAVNSDRRARARQRGGGSTTALKPGSSGPRDVVAAVLSMFLVMVAGDRQAAAAPPSPAATTDVGTYNEGTAAYRKKDFSAARDRFLGATHTTDLGVQSDAYYDLGNARYRLGQASLAKDKKGAIEAWKGAVASYDGALALRKDDPDARFNRDLVARRLAALEEQAREQQDQQKQQPRQGQSKAPQSSRQGQKDKPQAGKGEPQPAQGSAQNGAGQPSPGSSGAGAQGKSPGQDDKQGPRQAQGQQQGNDQKQDKGQSPQETAQGEEQSKRQGSSPGGVPDSAGKETDPSGQDRAGQGSVAHQPSAPRDHEGAAPGVSAEGDHGDKPEGPGVVSAANPSSGDDDASGSARRAPGTLSRGEATQLLDSVSGELRRMPVAIGNRRHPEDRENPIKDW